MMFMHSPRNRLNFSWWLSLALSLSGAGVAKPIEQPCVLPEVSASSAGFDQDRLRRIDAAVDRAIAEGTVPGAVVMVGRRGAIVYTRAAGLRAVVPRSEPMTRDTVFDMASLTKPVVTATAVMLLLEEGKLRLDDRVVRFLPELNNHGKDGITVEHLLRHRAGLVPDNPLGDYADGPDAAWKRIAEIGLNDPPGARFVYSDVGYLILGKLVERISGKALDTFANERIFPVVGMTSAHFRPTGGKSAEGVPATDRIAPTEPAAAGGPMLRGVVHDPRSRAWEAWRVMPASSPRLTTWPDSRALSSTADGRPRENDSCPH